MKNAVLVIIILMLPASIVEAQEIQNLARVQKIGDKEVYILNEPLRSYEFVDEIRTGIKWTSLLTRGIINEHVNDKTNQFVRRTVRKLEKKGQTFDAIVYRGGKKVQAIRFTDNNQNNENAGLAKIEARNGISTFIMAEPVEAYTVVEDIRNGVKLIPFITVGLVNNSIEKDIKSLSRRTANRDLGEVALIYQTGRRADIVTFID
jgi:hypothetical protein